MRKEAASTMAKSSAVVTEGIERNSTAGNALRVRPSQELVALGMCNMICSQFKGYPVTGSFSRTAVNAEVGSRSPLSAAFAAIVVGLVLMFLTYYIQYLPSECEKLDAYAHVSFFNSLILVHSAYLYPRFKT